MSDFKRRGFTLCPLLFILILSACASNVPGNTGTEGVNQPTRSEVMQTKPQQSTLQPQQTENVQTTTKKTITTHATTAAAEKTSMVPITMKTTTGKITATATITKALQARPRPTEPTPSMVKNQKLFLNSLPISEGAALGTAELLYQLGIDELTEVAVIPDGAWGYTVDAKEADGTAYLLVLSEYGYLSRVYMKGMWDTPLYAS